MRRRIRTQRALAAALGEELPWPPARRKAAREFGMLITPYYAALMRRPFARDPLLRMCVPDDREVNACPWLSDDPLAERAHTPVPGLVHRYRNRALVLATAECATRCRYCTRRRETGRGHQRPLELAAVSGYLREHPEIHDVILSGGDPLVLDDAALADVLSAIREVPSVRMVRIGTKVPVVLPMRVTPMLCDVLRRFHPLYINLHFNHPAELTPQARAACAQLADAGIPLGNQSVLLRGVNDCEDVLESLCAGLLECRVRPYYLHQCDLVNGSEHFRVPTARGVRLVAELRRRLGGMGTPVFTVDLPEAGCKIPLQAPHIVSETPEQTTLRAPNGRLVHYPEPRCPRLPGENEV